MNLTLFLSLTILVGFSFLGLSLLLMPRQREQSNKASQIFSLLIFSVIFWLVSNLMTDMSRDAFAALFWSKFTIVWASWLPSLFLLFTYYFPRLTPLKKSTKVFIFLPSFIILLLAPTHLNIEAVRIQENAVPEVKTGPLYLFLLIFFLIFLGIAFYKLYQNYHQVPSRIQKAQIGYVFFGALFSFLAGISTNLIAPVIGVSELARYSALSTIFFIVATVYALFRHHLFEIKVITTEIFTVLLIILLLWNVLESTSTLSLLFNLLFLIIAIVFAVFLIKSVLREVNLREKAQKLTQKLRQANRKLKKIDKTKSEFVSIASHQLRTPLSAIKGYAAMLLDDARNPEEKEALHKIYLSNERLIKLVNDLLNLSRIERGKLQFNFQKVQLSDILGSVVSEMKILAQKRGLKLFYQKEELPLLQLDANKIRQVFLNIIDNAIKYTLKGKIIVRTLVDDDNVIVVVQDTGIGMTKKDIQSLYQKFRRGKASFQINPSGTGIGLYIAHKIVQAHGGRIWAESAGLHKGTSFYISLPLHAD